MSLPRTTLVLGLVMAGFLLAVTPAQADIFPNDDHAFAVTGVEYPGYSWRGAQAQLEVRAGALSQDDLDANGWITQRLRIANKHDYPDYFAEVGVVRQPNSVHAGITKFYWCTKIANGTHWHLVTNLSPSDYMGSQPNFRILNTQGTNDWVVRIDGQYANDSGSDHTANLPMDHIDNYEVGLETIASSARYATLSDPADNINIMRNSGWSNWGFAQAQYALEPYLYDPSDGIPGESYADVDWTTTVESNWDFRNLH